MQHELNCPKVNNLNIHFFITSCKKRFSKWKDYVSWYLLWLLWLQQQWQPWRHDIQHNNTHHNNTMANCLVGLISALGINESLRAAIFCYAECRWVNCRYAECRGATAAVAWTERASAMKSHLRERRVKVEGRSLNIIDLEIKRKSRNGISFLWLLPWRRDVWSKITWPTDIWSTGTVYKETCQLIDSWLMT